MPNHVVIFIRHGVVRMIPVHKITQTLALFGLNCAEFCYSLLTKLNKFSNAGFLISLNKIFDIFFISYFQLFFYFDFHPQALTIKAVLESLFVSTHIPKPLPEVLVGPSPGMVNTHWIISSNWPV